mmetsp:Transcript_102236/g.312713  ORF Transcript_102236/g.312713 Transcript_102236/m.312713 type:complete len:205 (-) Transcript_102236:93-707(-)
MLLHLSILQVQREVVARARLATLAGSAGGPREPRPLRARPELEAHRVARPGQPGGILGPPSGPSPHEGCERHEVQPLGLEPLAHLQRRQHVGPVAASHPKDAVEMRGRLLKQAVDLGTCVQELYRLGRGRVTVHQAVDLVNVLHRRGALCEHFWRALARQRARSVHGLAAHVPSDRHRVAPRHGDRVACVQDDQHHALQQQGGH